MTRMEAKMVSVGITRSLLGFCRCEEGASIVAVPVVRIIVGGNGQSLMRDDVAKGVVLVVVELGAVGRLMEHVFEGERV